MAPPRCLFICFFLASNTMHFLRFSRSAPPLPRVLGAGALSLSVLLAACGGGGGGADKPAPTPVTPSASYA